jgi:nitroreductase
VISLQVLRRLVELACQAPSVHNTQPWQWRASKNRIRLYADRGRLLPEEDPLGRNLVISCGAALDHLQVAAHALGLAIEVTRQPEGIESDLLADVRLSPGKASLTAAEDIALLRTRCTDRRRFTSWPVPEATLKRLAGEAHARGAEAFPVTDTSARFRLELLAQRAHLARALDTAATAEQHRWVRSNGSDGVPVAVLPREHGPASARFAAGLVPETRTLVDSSDGVIVLGGRFDERGAWLRTGEALSSLWLTATRRGLSVVPMSLPVEVDATREELRDVVLGSAISPHLLLRIGWQAIGRSDLPRTPRRPVNDVFGVTRG